MEKQEFILECKVTINKAAFYYWSGQWKEFISEYGKVDYILEVLYSNFHYDFIDDLNNKNHAETYNFLVNEYCKITISGTRQITCLQINH